MSSTRDVSPVVRAAVVRRAVPQGTGRFAAFDGLRAVAVLMVFAIHLMGRYVPGGWIGVDVFFALSGYLITALLLGEVSRTGRVDLGAFYVRRLLRLAPALVALVVVVAPVAWLLGAADVPASGLAALTYTMDIYKPLTGVDNVFGQTWSLAVEEQFYLVWPLVLAVALKRGWPVGRIAVSLAAVTAAAGMLVAAKVSLFAAYCGPAAHVPLLLGGAWLAVVAHEKRSFLPKLSTGWIPAMSAVGAAIALFTLRSEAAWVYYGGLLAIGAVVVLLIGHIVAVPAGRTAAMLSARPLVWLGQRSYGFYLWHFPISWLAPHLGLPKPVAGLLAIAATLACTQLSWVLVEVPFLRLKNRFTRPTATAALAMSR